MDAPPEKPSLFDETGKLLQLGCHVWTYGPWYLVASGLVALSSIQTLKETLIEQSSVLISASQLHASELHAFICEIMQPHGQICDSQWSTEMKSVVVYVGKFLDVHGAEIYVTVKRPYVQYGRSILVYAPIGQRCCECLRELAPFFDVSRNVEQLLLPVVLNKSDVSQRMHEFFCVSYSAMHGIVYKITSPISGQDIMVDVKREYMNYLKMWKRECFDFFQRYTRIYVLWEQQLIQTTTGQLNGIYWSYSFGIYDYIRANMAAITAEMSSLHGRNRREIKDFKSKGKQRPRKALVQGHAVKTCSAHAAYPLDMSVQFDNGD